MRRHCVTLLPYWREGDTAAETESVLSIPVCVLGLLLARYYLYNGAIGAIASDVLLEACLVWSYTRLLSRGTLNGESLQGIGWCVLAFISIVALTAVLSAQGCGLWSLPLCVALYLAMCVALGCLRLQYRAPARQAFARRVGLRTP